MAPTFRVALMGCALGLATVSCATSIQPGAGIEAKEQSTVDPLGVVTPQSRLGPETSTSPEPTAGPTEKPAPYQHAPTLDNTDLQAAFDRLVAESPSVRVVREQTTSAYGNDESVSIDGYIAPDRTIGHASFGGLEPITFARAAGNADLGELLLTEGVSFVAIGDVLHFDRAVAAAWMVGVSPEGSAMVSVRLNELDESEEFVVELFAPFVLGPTFSAADQLSIQLIDSGPDGARYEGSQNEFTITADINDEAKLVGLEVAGPAGLGGESTFVFAGSYSSVTQTPEDASTSADEDVTEALKEYVRVRPPDRISTETSAADVEGSAPALLALVEPEWVQGWYIDVDVAFGDGVRLGSVSRDAVAVLNDGITSALWDLGDGAVSIIERTSQAQLSSDGVVAVAQPSSCTGDTTLACAGLRGRQLVDTSTGEIVALPDGHTQLVLSGDGTTLWIEGPALDRAGSQVAWANGALTELVSLDETIGVVRDDFTRATLVAVSIDGQRALFVPPTDGENRREFQLSAVDVEGTITPILATGSGTFTGGAALSEDGTRVLLGTTTGLALFDFAAGGFAATDLVCDDVVTWLRSSQVSQRVLEIEPGSWLVALTPSNLASTEPATVFLVEPATRSCDRVARILSSPNEGLFWNSLLGSPGSTVVGLAVLDNGLTDRYQEVILDLAARPADSELVYQDGTWSVVGPAG